MRKLIFTIAAVIGLLSTGVAQQVPLYSQYNYSKFLINPALTGMYNRPQLYLLHRNQWTGMPGNPVTNVMTIESALKNDKIGLGAMFYSDNIGISNTIGGSFSYAYKLKLAEEAYLGLGLGVGMKRLGIEFGNAVVKDFDDQSIFNFNTINRVVFDGTGGLNFNWRKLNVGFAIPNLVSSKAKFFSKDTLVSSSSYYTYVRHLAVNASYEFPLGKSGAHTLLPSLLLKRDLASGSRPMQLDVNVIYDYMRKYWGGVAYRTDYGVIASAGVKLFDALTVGYAYDIHTNKAWKGSSLVGYTHEIVLGYEFGRDKDRLEKKVNKLDTAVQNNAKKVNDLDSTVKDTKKKMDKMNNDLRKRDDDNFQNLKKDLDKMNGDIDELKKRLGEKNGTFTLTRIYFKTDRSELLPGSVTELDELVETLNTYKTVHIKIMGHTDSRNSESYNQKLSEKRAKAVYDYLVQKGISADRLEYEGYGKKLPIADNDTETGMQLNRRVEFKITKF